MYKCKATNEQVETYQEYLKTNHWKATKVKVFKKYKYHCAKCKTNKNIDLHHKTYKNVGNESMSDLVYLCRTCHKLVHDNKLSDHKFKLVLKVKNKRSKKPGKKKKKAKYSQKGVKGYVMTKEEIAVYRKTGKLPR